MSTHGREPKAFPPNSLMPAFPCLTWDHRSDATARDSQFRRSQKGEKHTEAYVLQVRNGALHQRPAAVEF